MMTSLWLAMAFIGAFAVVVGINLAISQFLEEREKARRLRVEQESRRRQAARARQSMANRDVYEMAVEGLVDPEDLGSPLERFRRFVGQSGLDVTAEQIVLIASFGALILGGGLGYLRKSVSLGVFVGLLVSVLPMAFVAIARQQRRNKMLTQLPDAYEMMARVLRSGQTMSQAMRGVADEFPAPLADEFAYCWEQQNLGLSAEASLKDLGRRTALLEIQIFVVALTIHRQTGGNLSHLLGKLSNVMRERDKIRSKISALTAEGKMQAYVLAAMPIALGTFVSITNPEYMSTLWQYPQLLVLTAVLEILGVVWMRKICNFDF
jgi:tight adherence protein B